MPELRTACSSLQLLTPSTTRKRVMAMLDNAPLFSLHAVLLLMGAPILFTGRWELMNLLVPVVGYGIIANLLSHLYARFALNKVRQLTTVDMGNE